MCNLTTLYFLAQVMPVSLQPQLFAFLPQYPFKSVTNPHFSFVTTQKLGPTLEQTLQQQHCQQLTFNLSTSGKPFQNPYLNGFNTFGCYPHCFAHLLNLVYFHFQARLNAFDVSHSSINDRILYLQV